MPTHLPLAAKDSGLTPTWTAWSPQFEPSVARDVVVAPLSACLNIFVPSVTTDQLPPLVDQPVELPSSKLSDASVAPAGVGSSETLSYSTAARYMIIPALPTVNAVSVAVALSTPSM